MKKKWFLGLLALCMSVAAVAFVGCDESGEGGAGNDDTNIEQEDGGETPESYTVTYDTNGGTFSNGATSITDTIEKNGKLIAPESPSRKNYSFSGWGSKNGGNMWDFATDTVTESITLYATWEQQSAVILSVDGASMEEKEIFMFVDKEVDSVSLADKVICSNDSTWKLYYDKLGQTEIPTKMAAGMNGYLQQGANEFYIVVTSNDGVQVNVYELNVFRSFPISIRYMDGGKLLEEFSAEAGYEYVADYVPEITGYKFNYWETLEEEPYQTQKLWTGLSLIANTTANTYTVTYDVNEGDELPQTDKEVTYDSDYTLAKPTRTGYSFVGWYYNGVKLTDENGQSIAAWDIPNNATFTAEWKVNQYTVALNKDVSDGGKVSGANDYDYNSEVTITASTNNGYVFKGWYDGEELLTGELSYTFQMPAENVSYTAKWRAVPVTLVRNNTSAGSVSSLNGKYMPDDEVTITATTDNGYVWLGWYNGDEMLTNELSYTFQMPTENVTYTAKWIAVPVTLERNNTNAGIVPTLNEKYILGDEVTITATTYMGHEFAGWYNGEELLTEELSYTFQMSTENVTYTATWEVAEELKSFNFTSTTTTCTVTGLKNKTVTELIIPDCVTSIAISAFKDCSELTSIVIPDSVTSIANGALAGCNGLTSITIPFVGARKNATGYESVFGYIFGYTTTSSSSSTVSGTTYQYRDSLNGYYNYYHYYIPTSLKKVTITGGNIGESAFYNCSRLTSIEIPNSVTSIGESAFYNCSRLTSMEIPDNVTSIGIRAFSGCSSLTSIEIPDSVTSIGGWAFADCSGLMSIVIGDSITSIDYNTFTDCSGLTSIVIGDSVASIGSAAFYGCSGLTSVYYNGTASDWRNITISSNNTNLTNATRSYYIENKADVPTDGGNYWHYVDGVPTGWEIN